MTLIIFLVVLSVLVLIHEAGHFLTARFFGIRVYEFALGFPPRALAFYKDPATGRWRMVWGKGKETVKNTIVGDEPDEQYPGVLYSIHWLPLGGFVRIKGENGERADEIDSFGNKKAWQRLVVLCAGVVMNILLAAIVLSTGFVVGLPVDVSDVANDRYAKISDAVIMVQQVEKDSPAEKAGLLTGDTIIKINNEKVLSSEQVRGVIVKQGTTDIALTIRDSGGAEKEVTITPTVLSADDPTPRLGVALGDIGIVKYPWYIAVPKGFMAAGVGVINILISFWILLVGLFTGQGLAFEVAGPVGIATIVGQSARLGFQYLLNVTAMISLSLAVINILPIPALDGGRAVFVLIEMITKRKVPLKYEQLAHTLGFVFLMGLVILVTWHDVAKLFG